MEEKEKDQEPEKEQEQEMVEVEVQVEAPGGLIEETIQRMGITLLSADQLPDIEIEELDFI